MSPEIRKVVVLGTAGSAVMAALVYSGQTAIEPLKRAVQPKVYEQPDTPTPSPTTLIPHLGPSGESTPTTSPEPALTIAKMRGLDPSVYWSEDTNYYSSPWFPQYAGQIMIGFGCTKAPYYSVDPACPEGEGAHHGIDIFLGCGTPITSPIEGIVVSNTEPNAPGPAYGVSPLRLRTKDAAGAPIDIIIGHGTGVTATPGQLIMPGDKLVDVSNSGTKDGCHLYFEERPAGGAFTNAIDPTAMLHLAQVQ